MNKINLMLFLICSMISISCTTSSTSSENKAPVASFTVTPSFGEHNFTFDASGCTDEEDPTSELKVRWDWYNNGTWDTLWDTAKIKTHQYPSTLHWPDDISWEYTVLLEVKDSGGLKDSTTVGVMVSNTPRENDPSINTFYK